MIVGCPSMINCNTGVIISNATSQDSQLYKLEFKLSLFQELHYKKPHETLKRVDF